MQTLPVNHVTAIEQLETLSSLGTRIGEREQWRRQAGARFNDVAERERYMSVPMTGRRPAEGARPDGRRLCSVDADERRVSFAISGAACLRIGDQHHVCGAQVRT